MAVACLVSLGESTLAQPAKREAKAEKRWVYQESIDDISNKKERTVVVVGDKENKTGLVLRVEEGGKPAITLIPGVVMFPDKTDAASKTMGISITMRSTVMEKPRTAMYRMPWMDYKAATIPIGKRSAVAVFAGDSVTFQLDKAGGRFKFATKGEGLEGLQEAVTKALEIAADNQPEGDAPPADKSTP
jgi:hypothetical protein